MRTIVNRNKIHVNASTISQRRAKAELTRNPVKVFLDEALSKEPNRDDYETNEDMHDAFTRFCKYNKLHVLGSDTFSETLRKDHGLKKGRKTIEDKKKTIWEECKLVKWKNTCDYSQKTLMNKDNDDKEEEEQEQPLDGEEKESREEKWRREQEEIAKWE